MDAIKSILSQYHASLAMLRQAIELCPDDLWLVANERNRYWHIAYHTLFYTHLYVNASEADFTPWPKHQPACRLLGTSSQELANVQPYSKAELLIYHSICCEQVADNVPKVPLDASSGFDWLPMNQFEVHLYNLRHMQHHTGQLTGRLRTVCDVGVPWVRLG
jgi:hypothetical protein